MLWTLMIFWLGVELSSTQTLLARYQERFRYINVDEVSRYQRRQYAITKILASKHRNLMVVGDDDQSIYSWRGRASKTSWRSRKTMGKQLCS